MSRFLPAALAASVLLAAAGAASAAVIPVTLSPPAGDGSISGTFGDTAIGAGSFSVTYLFSLPASGVTGATVTSIATASTNNVSFSTVTLNGQPFSVGSTGTVEFQFLNPITTTAGSQTLVVTGASGGDSAFSGTLAFSPTVVPEPAGWALMIAGIGLAGAALRRRRSAAAFA